MICGYSIYYFIALILQYYALLPVYQRANKVGVIASSIFSLASISLVTYVNYVQEMQLPLILYAGPFPVWGAFFAMGCYLRKNNRNYSFVFPIILTTIGVALQYVETYYWNINYSGGFGIKLSSFIYSIAVICFLFSAKLERVYVQNKFTKAIEYIGSISFAIYLYHMFTILGLKVLHINNIPWIFRWVFCMIVTIIGIEFLKRMIVRKYQVYLGV